MSASGRPRGGPRTASLDGGTAGDSPDTISGSSTFGVPEAERRAAARAERVANEQLRMVMSHSGAGTVLASAFAVLFAAYLNRTNPQDWLTAWIAAKLGVAIVRVGWAHWYGLRHHPGGAVWRNANDAMLAIDGAIWGVAGFLLAAAPVPLASLTAAALACVSCVATFGLQVRLRSTAAYVAPMLLLLIAGMLLRGDEFGTMSGIGLGLLLGLQLFTAHGAQRRLVAGIVLRLQSQRLAMEKDAAMREAQQASVAKTEFLAKVSHELRTPLHGILGVARLVHRESREPALQERIELIESSGVHLLGLINDLLDVSGIESGRLTLREAPFDLHQTVESVAAVFRVRAGDKGLDFRLVIEQPRPCIVVGDAARFRQVLHNLLGNAIKFTQRGRIKLHVRPTQNPELLCVLIRDTGVGINPLDHERIFDPFQQVGAAAGMPTQGAGLGLTVAREIAVAMGGQILVHSEPGLGATFEFTARLPLAPGVSDTPARDPAAAASEPWHERAERRALRLALVAEDDDVNALIVGAQLERLGVRVERVPDGQQAVGRALREDDRPDLILMDCRMPVMDGLDATREIRAQEQTMGLARVPIIALTATAGHEDLQACLDSGMDALIGKPYPEEQLVATLQRFCHLGGAPLSSQPPRAAAAA